MVTLFNYNWFFSENSFKFLRVFRVLFGGNYVRIRHYATEIRHFSPLFLLFCCFLNSFNVAGFLVFHSHFLKWIFAVISPNNFIHPPITPLLIFFLNCFMATWHFHLLYIIPYLTENFASKLVWVQSCKQSQLGAQFTLSIFINLCRYRATMCPSSGETTVFVGQLVFVILCG